MNPLEMIEKAYIYSGQKDIPSYFSLIVTTNVARSSAKVNASFHLYRV